MTLKFKNGDVVIVRKTSVSDYSGIGVIRGADLGHRIDLEVATVEFFVSKDGLVRQGIYNDDITLATKLVQRVYT